MDGIGGKPGWAWIFIIVCFAPASVNRVYMQIQEGLFTFLFGVISFFILPRSPAHARFLSAEEKFYVVEKLKAAGAISKDEKMDRFNWAEIFKALQSPQVWLLCIPSFFGGA